MKLRIVMISIILPLLALAGYFAVQTVTAEQARLAVATSAVFRAQEQVASNNLIHELQKERRYSAGYAASAGANFADNLDRQRGKTDRVIPLLGQTDVLAVERASEFGRATTALDQLSRIRTNVQNLAVSVPDVAGYYTAVINDLLLVSYPLGFESGDEKYPS